MNRFRVTSGRERESYLNEVSGFREFHLLRGPTEARSRLYVSHSVWDSRGAFEAWARSEAFRRAHASPRSPERTLVGPPQLEGYEVIL
jgi:heme-degrading monooxygenase HmoA